MSKGKIKINILAYLSMIIATILGIKAQSITYYISDNIINVDLLYCLIIITIISILLFWVPQTLIYKWNKEVENKNRGLSIYLGINLLVGIIVTPLSLVILIAWLG